MELSELVREIEGAHDPAAQARIERSRSTVMRGIAQPLPRRSRRRWIWGGTAAGTVTAGVIAATVIIAGTVSPLAAPPASAAAVAVLNDAAGAAMTSPDPVLAPGQYLRVRETYDLITLWDADLDSGYPYGSQPLDESEGAVHQRSIRDLYIPSDRDGDWILDDRQVNEVVDVYGDPRALADHEAMIAEFGGESSPQDPAGLVALPGGAAKEGETWNNFSDDYDEMPRDPEKLLQWYRDALASTSEDDWVVFANIGRSLGTDVMPADLRGASLQALALLTSVDVARTEGTVTTLKMDLPQESDFGDLYVTELDIDTSTGRIVGGREVYPHRSTDLIPDGVPWVSWTVAYEIVDEAPQP